MSAAGAAEDACASGAKPRREVRVRERWWRPTRRGGDRLDVPGRPHRTARRRAKATGSDMRGHPVHVPSKESDA